MRGDLVNEWPKQAWESPASPTLTLPLFNKSGLTLPVALSLAPRSLELVTVRLYWGTVRLPGSSSYPPHPLRTLPTPSPSRL